MGVSIRPYRKPDREAVRQFAANDEHERPRLLARHRRLGEYRAGGLLSIGDRALTEVGSRLPSGLQISFHTSRTAVRKQLRGFGFAVVPDS